MKIMLIPTDGSVHANKALAVGAALAKKDSAQVIVMHVLMRAAPFEAVYQAFKREDLPTQQLDELAKSPVMLPDFYMGGVIMPIVPLTELAKLGERLLDRAKQRLAAEGISNARSLLVDGDPANKILEAARSEGADVIVIGHRGLGAVEEVFAGSVSTKVGHRSSAVVITVKEKN